jgi:hypothetical protein
MCIRRTVSISVETNEDENVNKEMNMCKTREMKSEYVCVTLMLTKSKTKRI